MRWLMMSMGTGKMIVEFFSADMEFSVCKKKYSFIRKSTNFVNIFLKGTHNI
jgi:hypothetical protein